MDIDLKQLKELMRAMKQLGVSELEIEGAEQRIFLRRGSQQNTVAMAPTLIHAAGPASAPPPPLASAEPKEAKEDPNAVYITSPFVGTFYRSPSPDSPQFVTVGEVIKSGTVLCIIEAMKLMNEIEAEISGKLLEVMVEDGKPVEFGDRLFKIEKAG